MDMSIAESRKCMGLPPKDRMIKAPRGGWKEKEYYVVDVAFNPNNVIHRSIFYAGFLQDGKPAGYNQVINPSYDGTRFDIRHVHYMKVIRKINVEG